MGMTLVLDHGAAYDWVCWLTTPCPFRSRRDIRFFKRGYFLKDNWWEFFFASFGDEFFIWTGRVVAVVSFKKDGDALAHAELLVAIDFTFGLVCGFV